jgi:glycerophosphoryl diester phosphodiesterase
MASFDQALADGCDGFEFDVRLAVDGTPVVCHDPQSGSIEIAQASAQQLSALPQLQAVLARYRERAFLDIELKVTGLEKIMVALLREHPPRCGYVVSSFLPEVLHAVRAEDATVPLGWICEKQDQLRGWNQIAAEYVIPYYKLVDPALIQQVHGAGRKIFVWTVNSAPEMLHFAESGVDGIISDSTRLLCHTLSA